MASTIENQKVHETAAAPSIPPTQDKESILHERAPEEDVRARESITHRNIPDKQDDVRARESITHGNIPQKEEDVRAHGSTPEKEEDVKKWGTHEMGAPAYPDVHPDNQQAAHWQAQQHNMNSQQPYLIHDPVDKSTGTPFDAAVNSFNFWSHRAEDIARNIWNHLKAGPSVSGAAWGKFNLTAKAFTEGGFESLFKQIFSADPNEKLKKTFACYLSTSTGPVAGTIYLSTARVAFCSDRPLSYKAPSGQESWTYYKLAVPIGNIRGVDPEIMKENPPEKYLHITTVDGHEFWFMGFVNFEKASHHLLDAVSDFRATTDNVNHT